MSLVPFAIRICTTRALQTALPENVVVVDSPQEPLDHLDVEDPRPVVAIYTGKAITRLEGRNLLGGEPAVLLTVQIFLPETFTFSVAPGQTVTIDTRRQGAETALDVIWRGALLALNGSQEPWAALWREFVPCIATISNQHYVLERNSVKVTAREVSIECEPIHEPIPGSAPYLAWEQLVDLMHADDKDDGLGLLGDWVEHEIRNSADRPLAARDTAYIGLSNYVAKSLRVQTNLEDVAIPASGVPLTEAYADPDAEQ